MSRYSVIAPALNLRSAPTSADPFNILGVLSFQTVVEVLEQTSVSWWKIKTISTGLSGFVSSRFLAPLEDTPIVVKEISKANYPKDKRASLFTKGMMHKPIGTPNIAHRDVSSPETKRESIGILIDTLNVEHSERYRPTEKNTFCNIYAYDFCHFSDTYIPRVWWKEKAIKKLLEGQQVEVLYGETVYELNANALHDWLLEWGDDFGWRRISFAEEMQNAVNNEGGVGIICAKRRDTRFSGHITVVVPETNARKADRQAGVVLHPLQSQAGGRNRKYFSKAVGAWWRKQKFSSFVFYYHP
ncbi:MAG: SH3 domain-containing protein [Saonia sp.]